MALLVLIPSVPCLFRQTSHFCDGSGGNVTFEHPFLQGVGMFLGEFLCLLVFKFIWFSTAQYRIERMTYKGDASSPIVRYWPIKIKKEIHLVDGEQTFNPFIFWVASICDMLSTCLSYVALNYTSASSFQMLRGSVMVFTAILRYRMPSDTKRLVDHRLASAFCFFERNYRGFIGWVSRQSCPAWQWSVCRIFSSLRIPKEAIRIRRKSPAMH